MRSLSEWSCVREDVSFGCRLFGPGPFLMEAIWLNDSRRSSRHYTYQHTIQHTLQISFYATAGSVLDGVTLGTS